MAKVVVTGGSGFIGSHVVDAMLEAGHAVTVVDNRIPSHRPEARYLNVDVLDAPALTAALEGAEHIYHLAAVANVNEAFARPVQSSHLNIVGTGNVLEAARVHGAKRVYLASTIWVYNCAAGEGSVDETATFHPEASAHIYTSSKLSAEMLCYNYQDLYNVPVTVLRYGVPYGPRMREELLIPVFLKKALEGRPLTIAGRGEQFRKFVFVPDMAQAHVMAMRDEAAGQTYNLEGDRKVTILEVAEGIRQLLGGETTIEFAPPRPGDFSGRDILAGKAKDQLGWVPRTQFEQGLESTVRWFRDHWRA
jgi:UDP-glucose 4-epimerase